MRIKFQLSSVLVAVPFVLLFALWVRGFWFTEVFTTHRSNEPNRAALLKIYEAVPIGGEHSEVLAAYWHHRTDRLILRADKADSWIIRMPLEFGASDWCLSLKFAVGKVTSVRMYTSDGDPPKDGPPEKRL